MSTINVRPVWRDMDLSPLGDEYRGDDGSAQSLRVRINWTRGQKRRRWDIAAAIGEVQQEFAKMKDGADAPDDKVAELSRRSEQLLAEAYGLWGEIFDCTGDEMEQLSDLMPEPHWDWVKTRAYDMALEYEAEEAKKLAGSRRPGSQKRRKSRQK